MRTPLFSPLRRYWLLLLTALLTLSAAQWSSAQITFADPALDSLVRGQFSKELPDGLLPEDAELISTLYNEWPEEADRVRSLEGIGNLPNLSRLNLRGNAITDVAPLAQLTYLEDLVLHRNELTDVSALASLTHLRFLDLRENQISDASSLAGMAELEVADLTGNQLTQIPDLSGLQRLAHLNLHDNALQSLAGLDAAPDLLTVTVYGNPDLDLCPGSADRQIVDQLIDRGVEVAYLQRAAGDRPCAEQADAAPLQLLMLTGGQEESIHVQDGQLARLNPDGTRTLVSCVGSVQTALVINEPRGVYWSGLMSQLAQELSMFIPLYLLPDDTDVRYAVNVSVEQAGQDDVAGYASQHYNVTWRPSDEEDGADQAWQLMQEVWVAPSLGEELQAAGCFEVAAFLETFQLLQGSFSSQRFYGLAGSPEYGAAVLSGLPVRAVLYTPASGETVETELVSVSHEPSSADLFRLPQGLQRVAGIGEVF